MLVHTHNPKVAGVVKFIETVDKMVADKNMGRKKWEDKKFCSWKVMIVYYVNNLNPPSFTPNNG